MIFAIGSEVFTHAATAHVGAQKMPLASEGGQLTFKRYDADTAMLSNRNWMLSQKGELLVLIDNATGTNYSTPPYGWKYYVDDVQLLTVDVIPHWSGYRSGLLFDFAPASRVIARWTLYAVPAS